MAHLIDTSAWVDYLRDVPSRAADEVERLLTSDAEVFLTEPIVMELLAGAPTTRALTQLESLTNGMSLIRIDPLVDYHDAAAVFRAARRDGRTVRKLLDCLIATVAMRGGATLVHKDADFDVIANCAPLSAMSVR